jgi:hypothetical protein
MRIGGENPRYELVPVEPEGAGATSLPPRDVTGGAGPSFTQALQNIGAAVDRGEALIGRASRGGLGGLDSAQLIALQAGIYRYSEAVDLVAKLVDRASNAVRTIVSAH